ncbi:hypothetical protein Tco_1025444 [Tanacetum coccineum]
MAHHRVSPPTFSPPTAPYRRCGTVQGTRKTVRPQPTLSLSTLALITDWTAAPLVPSPPPSLLSPLLSTLYRYNPPLCHKPVSPTPALPIAGELAVIASALPSVPIELLPPHKRFTTIERIETLEIEVKSLTARLTEAEI